ncbi:Aurora kinase C, partial [Bienertia sinuspersici]
MGEEHDRWRYKAREPPNWFTGNKHDTTSILVSPMLTSLHDCAKNITFYVSSCQGELKMMCGTLDYLPPEMGMQFK